MSDSSSTWAAINTGRIRHYFIGNGMESLCKREYVPSIHNDESKFARCTSCTKILDAMTPEERADIVIGDALEAGRKWLNRTQVETLTDMEVLLHEAKRSQKVMRRVLNTGRPAVESQAVTAYTLAWDALTLARSLAAPAPAEGPTEPVPAPATAVPGTVGPVTTESYTITITGQLYNALRARDAFANDNPVDLAAITALDAAVHTPRGRGLRVVITGSKETVSEILGYVGSLVGLLDNADLTASELGVSRKVLESTSDQTPIPATGEAAPEPQVEEKVVPAQTTGGQYTSIQLTSDVTNEITIFAITIADNHYPTGRIDWEDLWDRLDGVELKDGTRLDLGSDLTTPAIGKLKRAVQANRR